MVLNMKTYKGFNKFPYCEAWVQIKNDISYSCDDQLSYTVTHFAISTNQSINRFQAHSEGQGDHNSGHSRAEAHCGEHQDPVECPVPCGLWKVQGEADPGGGRSWDVAHQAEHKTDLECGISRRPGEEGGHGTAKGDGRGHRVTRYTTLLNSLILADAVYYYYPVRTQLNI